jgi:hypothetical protein
LTPHKTTEPPILSLEYAMAFPPNSMADKAAHTDAHSAPLSLLRSMAMGALLVVTPWLGWKAWDVNITMSCWKYEWPELAVCKDIMGQTMEEMVPRLKQRLAKNPGDSTALVNLAILAHPPNPIPGLDGPALLAAAAKAAPQDYAVLELLADQALQKQQWPQALNPLIRLSLWHNDPDSTQTLADLIDQSENKPQLATALMAATQTDGRWLDRVLRAMPKEELDVSIAMPLIEVLMASRRLTPSLGQFVIRALKHEESWSQAHAVWRYFWQSELPLVFNGDFERPFVRDGFDWEIHGVNDHRSGARIDRVGRKDHGQVLKVAFTGKAFRPPILRQDLVLAPGRYWLRGDMQSSDFRSAQGLAWVVSCAHDGRELGRSPALKVTGRVWSTWQVEITMPEDCSDLGAHLTLQTFAPYEAQTGLRGQVLLDNITMTHVDALK